MPVIEIPYTEPVDLGRAVSLAEAEVAGLRWSILEFWAVAKDEGTDVVTLEQQASASPTGMELSTADLLRLAEGLLQLVDGIVVGFRDEPPVRSQADLRGTSEVVIEAVDSTYWRFYAREPKLLDRLRREWNDTRDVEPEVAIRPVHELS